MHETEANSRATLPEEVMMARLAQSEQMREFFIEMWKQNPVLAKQGGARVQSLLTPMTSEVSPDTSAGKQRGVSLIELIMFIVIIGIAVTGVLLVMNKITGHGADSLIRKQALAIAESLLEEIELQDFISASGVTSAVTQANRATDYHIVSDYNGFTTTGIFTPENTAVPDLSSYSIIPPVAVEPITAGELGAAIPAASAVRITVTVTDPAGQTTQSTGYRVAY